MPKFKIKNKQRVSQEDYHYIAERRPVRTLLEWKALSRPYRKKDISYYRTIGIIVSLMAMIGLLMQEFLFIGVLIALTFVAYVLAFVPPEEIQHKISTQGITVGENFYFWDDLDSFWFSHKEGYKILNILTNLRLPAQLMIITGSLDEDQVKDVVAQYLPFHEIAPKNFIDRWSELLQKIFPMESPKKTA